MRNFVDLHTHSIASDGQFTPSDLVLAAERNRLAAVALTDHDTLAGLAEAARAAGPLAVRLVPGVEVSAPHPTGTLHILGLGIDPAATKLADMLATMRQWRDQRNPLILAKLNELGVSVSMEEVVKLAPAGEQAVVSRLHIAGALVRKGQARDISDAFDRYLDHGRPAYVEKDRFAPADIIECIHTAGGLAVVAHPVQLKCGNLAQLRQALKDLRNAGLDGIEVYHSDHTPLQTRHYLDLARELGLLISGGSDFHGGGKPDVRLGRPRVPLAAVEQLLARLGIGGDTVGRP